MTEGTYIEDVSLPDNGQCSGDGIPRYRDLNRDQHDFYLWYGERKWHHTFQVVCDGDIGGKQFESEDTTKTRPYLYNGTWIMLDINSDYEQGPNLIQVARSLCGKYTIFHCAMFHCN